MERDNIFGCFFKIGFDPDLSEQDATNLANMFKTYIWGDKGIDSILKELKHKNYGKDLIFALFEFYVKPTPAETEKLKETGSYRQKEKSIGIPIIVTDKNFFNKSEKQRYDFLKESIFKKLNILEEVIKKKKLDTDIDLLRSDLERILNNGK